ncbi:hypothetical protein LOAG_00874 [Loa loa]|uniref:Uncharacterized protein n=1 Tax=Loa loa TaxID=7209 RepID=A0A1S0UAE9_LOALO|nr:hypothetical protein LOAG_00874 [Loa loa]EFO27605.1 hypothetical protein LOAG_00874 [Loa loa]
MEQQYCAVNGTTSNKIAKKRAESVNDISGLSLLLIFSQVSHAHRVIPVDPAGLHATYTPIHTRAKSPATNDPITHQPRLVPCSYACVLVTAAPLRSMDTPTIFPSDHAPSVLLHQEKVVKINSSARGVSVFNHLDDASASCDCSARCYVTLEEWFRTGQCVQCEVLPP